MMKIFLSYASEDKDAAERIYLGLEKANHQVFFDRTDLPAGSDFDSRIRDAIGESELFIFLISPDSVAKFSYALTELKIAREKWRNPVGRVLPVMIRETGYDLIPNYLKAITVLEPEGNVSAEVAARVANWGPNSQMRAPAPTPQIDNSSESIHIPKPYWLAVEVGSVLGALAWIIIYLGPDIRYLTSFAFGALPGFSVVFSTTSYIKRRLPHLVSYRSIVIIGVVAGLSMAASFDLLGRIFSNTKPSSEATPLELNNFYLIFIFMASVVGAIFLAWERNKTKPPSS